MDTLLLSLLPFLVFEFYHIRLGSTCYLHTVKITNNTFQKYVYTKLEYPLSFVF